MRHKIKIVVGCVLIITGFLATNIAVGQLTSLQNDTRTKCSGIVTEGGEKTVGREDGSYKLAEKYNVEMPIVEQVNAVLFDDKKPSEAVKELMLRDKKIELADSDWR